LALKILNISKQWPSFALKNINLTVESGEYFALLGPNGAGKTMLLETIMGFTKPDKGEIYFDGQDLTDLAPEKRNIGYVPQATVLFPHLTVYENVRFGLKMRNINHVKQKEIVNQVLELTKLTALESRLPSNLSGGEKQKVALARILALDPQLVLLDEPLISVDTVSARELQGELKQLNKKAGKTIVHVTHSLVEAASLADRMAIMENGELLQVGKPKELMAQPKNAFVAQFLGYENFYSGKFVEIKKDFAVLDVGGFQFKVSNDCNFRVGESRTFALHPENIILGSAQPLNSHVNSFSGRIVNFEEFGSIIMVTVDVKLMLKVVVTKNAFLEKGYEIGTKIWVCFNLDAAKFLAARAL